MNTKHLLVLVTAMAVGCSDGKESPVDPCTTGEVQCGDHATCVNGAEGAECRCDVGYAGDGITCTNVDECAEGTDNCHQHATCTDTDGSFDCACVDGYSGDGVDCVNIDECVVGTDNCHDHATCTDNDGSFTCACNAGYSGDGLDCVFDCPQPAPTGPYPRVHSIPVRCSAVGVYTSYLSGDVAIAEDVLVVGLPSWLSDEPDDHSSAFLFRFDGNQWQYVQELLPSVAGADPGKYGQHVEISRSGDTIVVASQRDAFVFRRNGTDWVGGEQLLPDFDPDSHTLLASAATTDQHTVLAYYGAEAPDAASVYVFDPVTLLETSRLADARFSGSANGNSVNIDGDLMVVANRYSGGSGANATVVFRHDGSGWQEEQELPHGSDAATDGARIIAYSYFDDAVFIYELDTSWSTIANVRCDNQCDLSVFGNRLVTSGAPAWGNDWFGSIFLHDGGAWNAEYTPDYEAYYVDITGNFAVMAANGFDDDPVQVIQFTEYP